MAERRPLVVVSGSVQELPSGDTLLGAAAEIAGMVQGSATLAQNQSLTVNHAGDPAHRRVVQAVATVLGSLVRANPLTTGVDSRATASSEWNSSYAAWKAFSSQYPTNPGGDMWESQNGSPQWIAWDFGSSTSIEAVRFCSYASDTMPTAAKVQGSANGSAWDDVATISPTATSAFQTFSFAATSYRYWRLYFTAASSRGDTMVGSLGWLATSPATYVPIDETDYSITLNDTSTVLTRTASGSETVALNVMLAGQPVDNDYGSIVDGATDSLDYGALS